MAITKGYGHGEQNQVLHILGLVRTEPATDATVLTT